MDIARSIVDVSDMLIVCNSVEGSFKKPQYKTTKINNRRYLGNKYKLLPFIKSVVEENTEDISSVADIFAGTGAVASAFPDKIIITNDTLYSNYICHVAWFGSREYSKEKISKYVMYYNSAKMNHANYMTKNFADTYFSKSDCCRIGYIRQNIEDEFKSDRINEEVYNYEK